MKELDISEIHEKTLLLFKEIESICDILHINYFIAYGTLIGAVRHKGFIPWDDDFDIIMLRNDFDIFVTYCHNNYDNDTTTLKLLDYTNMKNYPYIIPRFCDLKYKMVTDDYEDINMGLFIDIYPFDGVGNNKNKAIRQFEYKKVFYIHCLRYSIKKKFDKRNDYLKRSILFFVYLYAKKKSPNYFRKKLIDLKKKYSFEKSKYIACAVWDSKLKPIEKWHYENFEFLEFEGLKVKVPIGYDEVLRNSYGDYMVYPPLEEQVPSHNYKLYKYEEVIE